VLKALFIDLRILDLLYRIRTVGGMDVRTLLHEWKVVGAYPMGRFV